MSNKRRIIISIHHRDQFSLGEHRTRLGHAAYHWGILIQPKNPKGSDSDAYDVTDAAIVDPGLEREEVWANTWDGKVETKGLAPGRTHCRL